MPSRIGKRTPPPTVILLDLKMPGLDGFDFLDWLRNEAGAALRLIPVIVYSSSIMESDIIKAYALGANTYLNKQADWDTFQECIKTVITYWSVYAETPLT